jgi:hypothetical protein
MSKNVKLPVELFSRIIDLLDYIDLSGYDQAIQIDCDNIMLALIKKKQSLELREAYAKIVFAEDEDARHDARMRYLRQKRCLNDDF